MELLGELLFGELVEDGHLFGEHLGHREALGEEHNLADLLQVGHNDDHRSKERLDRVGQLGAASVAGIHGDEDADARVERDLGALEHEALHLGDERLLDGLELRRDDREDRGVDAIELVEAAPGATLTQAVEVLADGLEVHALAAIGDHAQEAHGLGQVLDGLGLAGAGRTGGRAAQVHGQALRDGQVDAIGEGRDDEASVEAHVLVAVAELARALADHELVGLAHPVEAQLRLPLEFARVQHRVAHKAVDDVARVHVDDEHRVELLAIVLADRGRADLDDDLLELNVQLTRVVLHGHLVAARHLLEHVLDLPRPPDLVGGEHDHALVVVHPLDARLVVTVVVDGLLGDEAVGALHLAEHFGHPVLDAALGDHVLTELHDLALGRDHRLRCGHIVLALDQLEARYVVEHLDHVLLHARRIAAAQYAEQLVVGYEEEARKRVTLRVQVVVEALLALLQTGADRLQVGQAVGRVARLLHVRLSLRLGHDLTTSTKKIQI